jgi:hypothetical protein
MEGLINSGRWIVGGLCAVGTVGYLAMSAYSVYHGGVTYRLQSRKIGWTETNTEAKRPSWEKEFWVFSLAKGPGKENVTRDLQWMMDCDEGEEKYYRTCKCCGATNEEILVKSNQ